MRGETHGEARGEAKGEGLGDAQGAPAKGNEATEDLEESDLRLGDGPLREDPPDVLQGEGERDTEHCTFHVNPDVARAHPKASRGMAD